MIASRLAPLKDHAGLQPDVSRALRATFAFMVPVLVAASGRVAFDVSFVAIAAQNIAMVDVRGDYRLRLALLVAMAGVFAASAALGATVADNLTVAVLATGLMAVAGGMWRHLSSDYGPSLAISSTLVFFLALASPHGPSTARDHAFAALAGGLWGVFVQVALWPFRPQHALRRTVAESWLGVATLVDALAEAAAAPDPAHERVREREAAARTMLDHTFAALAAAPAGPLRTQLEALNMAAARVATRVVALDTAIDPQAGGPCAALEPVLAAVAELARNTALTVVSRQPAHLGAFEVRLRQLHALLDALHARLAHDPAHAQLAELARQLQSILPEAHETLRATIARADERAAFSLRLPDLHSLALRPLASALNLSLDIDPALVRYTLRLAALTMFGVFAFKFYGIPHGYWLPFTIVVVLQPDFGATRQRAAQRVLGTLAGGLLGSGLLWLDPSKTLVLVATTATLFAFGFYVKRDYARAVFFVTLFIVLLTEAHEPLTIAFTAERLASTLAGGALALTAAFVFWPVWERDRWPPILAAAFTANRDYLRLLAARLASGGGFDREVIEMKRRAERANTAAFSSLHRLSGEPRNRREGLEHAATLANGNQRLTRTFNVLALHLTPGTALTAPAVADFTTLADEAIAALADAAVNGPPAPGRLQPLLAALDRDLVPPENATSPQRWIFAQLSRSAMELSALLIAVENTAPAWDVDEGR